jgi:hypothetical protein
MQLDLRSALPFTTIVATHRGGSLSITDVLVDTGSAGTVLSANVMAQLSVFPEPSDRLRALRGIGGRELVFTRRLDRIEVAGRALVDVEVEIGAMDYGFRINGILGMDFLRAAGAVLDLRNLTLSFLE